MLFLRSLEADAIAVMKELCERGIHVRCNAGPPRLGSDESDTSYYDAVPRI
jgi:hypothetical protein